MFATYSVLNSLLAYVKTRNFMLLRLINYSVLNIGSEQRNRIMPIEINKYKVTIVTTFIKRMYKFDKL